LRFVWAGGKDRDFVTAPASQPARGKSLDTLANELVSLVIAYVKQETVVPIQALGRFVLFGFVGALLLAIGGGLLALAAVRAIQSFAGHHLHGSLTWVPYTGGLLVAAVGAVWAFTRIGKGIAER
jgi:hypothetical protein